MFSLSALLTNLLTILAAVVLVGVTIIAVVFIASFVYIMIRNMIAGVRKGEKK